MNGLTDICLREAIRAWGWVGQFPNSYVDWKRGASVGWRVRRGLVGFWIFGFLYLFVPMLAFLAIELALLICATVLSVATVVLVGLRALRRRVAAPGAQTGRLTVVLVVALLSVVTLVSAAHAANGQQTTRLLTPSGAPVAGVWQRWMNDSYMPTYRGAVELAPDFDGQCGLLTGAVGCTTWPNGLAASALVQISKASIARERQTLLYEQAHVIDFAYLTDPERLQLLALWHKRVPAGETVDQFWLQGETDYWGQPVMTEWFADDYSLCALHRRFTWRLMDREGGNWVGADSYPVYSDFRQSSGEESGSPKKWRYFVLPPTHAEARWRLVQEKSCGLIRRWIVQA